MSRYEKFTNAGVKMFELGPAFVTITDLNEKCQIGEYRWKMRAILGDDDRIRYMVFRPAFRDERRECEYLTGIDPVQVTRFVDEE